MFCVNRCAVLINNSIYFLGGILIKKKKKRLDDKDFKSEWTKTKIKTMTYKFDFSFA